MAGGKSFVSMGTERIIPGATELAKKGWHFFEAKIYERDKMNNPCISIVVPVYCVEQYLSRCLDSIIAQTYKNLDIILVDDGSTDSSDLICDEYQNEDKRIRTFHKENGGLSDARNYGIMKAKGSYITFIDSDDYVTPDYVEFLYNLISKNNYPMAVCSLYTCFTNSNKIIDNGNGTIAELSGKECIQKMCYHQLVDTCAYAKLYDIRLFKNVRFPVGKIFEDIGTVYKLFAQCNKIVCGFQPKYYYMIRPNSIVTSSFSESKLDMLYMVDNMADYVMKKYPDLRKAVIRRQVYGRFSTLNQMLDVSGEKYISIREDIINFIKENQQMVLRDNQAPIRDKIAILCLKIGFPFYKLCWLRYFYFSRTDLKTLLINLLRPIGVKF